MTTEDQSRDVFVAALRHGEIERSRFLDQHCRDDPGLRARVDSLLRHHASAEESFLSPVAAVVQPLRPGQTFGRYVLDGVIGAGAMGVVYLAHQDRPSRHVALKVMRPGVASSAALRRFEREAEVLGRLHHPAIAHIYEAGAADAGVGPQPYFAMELLHGEALHHYARSRGMDHRGIARLMASVCDAVQHAHERGVVHRDLKPANVLVESWCDDARVGVEPRPKILDFGVAMVAGAQPAPEAIETGAHVVGTLAYMSPEQACGRTGLVDARSDVYSLGAILYELLAGHVPLDLRGLSLPDALQQVRDTDPPALPRWVPSDLSQITAAALNKDPSRRYPSAARLAADLRRFADHLPVEARRAGLAYRACKFAKRHRTLVWMMSALHASLLIAFVGVGAALVRERAHTARLESFGAFVHRMLAIPMANAKKQYNQEYMLDMLTGASRSAEIEFHNDPRVLGEVQHLVGATCASLSLFEGAISSLRRAHQLRAEALGADDPATVQTLFLLAWALVNGGDVQGAEAAFRQVVAARTQRLGAGHADTLDALHEVAVTVVETCEPRRMEEGLAIVSKVLSARRRAGPPLDIAECLVTYGTALRRLKRFDLAAEAFEEALTLNRSAVQGDREQLAGCLVSFGRLEAERRHFGRAEDLLREGLTLRRALLRNGHAAISFPAMHLGVVLSESGEFDEAEALCQEAIAIRRDCYGTNHSEVTDALWCLALVVERRGDKERAVAIYNDILQRRTGKLGPEDPLTIECADRLKELGAIE